MSSTFSELAAAALLEALASQHSSGRHLVTTVPGGAVGEVFREVLARADHTRGVRSGPDPDDVAELLVIEDGDGCVVVPYLVIEPPPKDPRPNRGGQGFVGALRDHFTDAAGDGERIMLLTFDEAPNETELTTMDQGIASSALDLQHLFSRSLAVPDSADQALRRTLKELAALPSKKLVARLTPQLVGRTAQAAAFLAETETALEVAQNLHRMPWCLKDPDLFKYAGADFRRRIEEALELRGRLEAWAADPSTDFDAAVRSTFSDAAALKVQSARTGATIDWSRFTYGDLRNGEPTKPEPEDPLSFASVPVTVDETAPTKLLADGQTIVTTVRGPGCTLTFHLTAPLRGKATIHLLSYEGAEPPFSLTTLHKLDASAAPDQSSVALELDALPQPREGWSFLKAVLTKGARLVKSPLGTVTVALRIDPDDPELLIYEPSGGVDLEAQAFEGDEGLTLVGERGGEEVFATSVEPPEAEYGALVEPEPGSSVPAVQADITEEAPGEARTTQSPEHLAVEAWAAGQLTPGGVSTSLRRRPSGEVVADVGLVPRELEAASAMPLSRWELERHAIDNPRTTAFRISRSGALAPNQEIERLDLGPLATPFDAFLDARERFFGELATSKVPSVLSHQLDATEAAQAYLEAYDELLSDVPDGEPGHLGYDRLLLVDSFTSDASREVLFAPTSPPGVALHLDFQRKVQEWTASVPASNYFAGDISLVSAQHLVPFLRLATGPQEWLEAGYAPYPWRRYLPTSERTRLQRHPSIRRYIARRVERFLDVHPSYRDERRTLRIAFINPGGCSHIRDALLLLADPAVRRKDDEGLLRRLPAFELQLLSDDTGDSDDLLGADLDIFMGLTPEEGQPSDTAMEVMKRLTYTKGTAARFLTDPKSFAHMTFVENFFRPQSELVEWPRGAHPSSFYVAGLAVDTERLAQMEPAATRFLTSSWVGSPNGLLERVAGRSIEVSAAATGVPVKRGITRAADVRVPDAAITQLYERSVWVVHIDRHVGLELFYPQELGSRAPYILDYTDQESPEPNIFDGITATHQVRPYHARVAAVFGEVIGDHISEAATEKLLRTMNLISGRWGIEMLHTPASMLRARLATVLAAQAIEASDRLHDQPGQVTIVVALDELLRATGAEGLRVDEGWLAKAGKRGGGSDDLFILSVPLGDGRPQMLGRIVEVKFRKDVGNSPAEAAKQIERTHNLLTDLLVSESQPGRAFQGRHLAKLILQYTGRHVSYGVRSGQPAISSGTEALTRIAAGDYDLRLDITRGGARLLGDFVSVEPTYSGAAVKPDVHTTSEGLTIGRIRIGLPSIRALLEVADSSSGIDSSDRDLAVSADDGQGPAAGSPQARTETDSEDPEQPGTSNEADSTTGWHEVPPQAQTGLPGDVVPPPRPEGDDGSGQAAGAPTASKRKDDAAESTGEAEGEGPGDKAPPYTFAVPDDELRALSSRLDDVLTAYKLPLQPVEPQEAVCGPNTIRFKVRMARGGTIAQVEARERDILRELGVDRPIMVGQDAGFVTLDVPRTDPLTVRFNDLIPNLAGRARERGELPVLFGVDLAGRARVQDLADLPHLLVAGSTGSGKSVFLSSLLGSLALIPPSELEIVLVDVKGLDFAPFRELPHLRQPPITDAQSALDVLEELYETERAKRQAVLADAGAQSILDYYQRLGRSELTQIVIAIDEFSNLLGGDKAMGSQLEDAIQKYAEIMRSFGVYLVIATQRPSADVVTGRIKANLPARCAFRLPTHSDSMTILGRKGAEQLLGKGDMLFYRDGSIERIQAPLTSAQDVLGSALRE